MINYLLFFLFFFGLFIGSFLNMLIDRLPRGEQVLTGRSHCDKCGKELKWFDMFPVFSWFFLRGKCRFCRSPIPFRNTLVEIITAMVFLWVGVNSDISLIGLIRLICELIVFSSLIAVFFIDLDHRIIPDELVIMGILGSIGILVIGQIGKIGQIGRVENYIFSGLGAAGFLLLLYFFTIIFLKKEGMGLGDVKFAFFMGLFLGWPKILTAFYIAFLTGALTGVILILRSKKKSGDQIAFGPFLIIGTFISYYFSGQLLRIFLPVF